MTEVLRLRLRYRSGAGIDFECKSKKETRSGKDLEQLRSDASRGDALKISATASDRTLCQG